MGKHTNTWLCSFGLAVEFPFNHILADEFQLTMNIYFHSSIDMDAPRLSNSVVNVLSLDDEIKSDSENLNLGNFDSSCHYYFSDSFNDKSQTCNCQTVFQCFI